MSLILGCHSFFHPIDFRISSMRTYMMWVRVCENEISLFVFIAWERSTLSMHAIECVFQCTQLAAGSSIVTKLLYIYKRNNLRREICTFVECKTHQTNQTTKNSPHITFEWLEFELLFYFFHCSQMVFFFYLMLQPSLYICLCIYRALNFIEFNWWICTIYIVICLLFHVASQNQFVFFLLLMFSVISVLC